MKTEDVSFLQNFKDTLQRAQNIHPDPDFSSRVTVTLTDHLNNLKLNVLLEMWKHVSKCGVEKAKEETFRDILDLKSPSNSPTLSFSTTTPPLSPSVHFPKLKFPKFRLLSPPPPPVLNVRLPHK